MSVGPPMHDARMRASRTVLLAVVAGLATIVAAASDVAAQNPSPPYPYPANDTPLTLSPGIVVRVRDLVVFRGHNVSSLTVVLQSPTPAADSTRVASEALAVAKLHGTFAQTQGIDHISVMVCRTQACLAMQEPASEMFHFIRAADGSWTADPGHRREQ